MEEKNPKRNDMATAGGCVALPAPPLTQTLHSSTSSVSKLTPYLTQTPSNKASRDCRRPTFKVQRTKLDSIVIVQNRNSCWPAIVKRGQHDLPRGTGLKEKKRLSEGGWIWRSYARSGFYYITEKCSQNFLST